MLNGLTLILGGWKALDTVAGGSREGPQKIVTWITPTMALLVADSLLSGRDYLLLIYKEPTMPNATRFTALQCFSITRSVAPTVYKYQWDRVCTHWYHADIEPGDYLCASDGLLSVFRDWACIAKRDVTPLALRSFVHLGWIEAA
jgi:hypothetical protein